MAALDAERFLAATEPLAGATAEPAREPEAVAAKS